MTKTVGENREAWKKIECFRDRWEQPHRLKALAWSEVEGSQEGGGQSTEEYRERTVPKASRR